MINLMQSCIRTVHNTVVCTIVHHTSTSYIEYIIQYVVTDILYDANKRSYIQYIIHTQYVLAQ